MEIKLKSKKLILLLVLLLGVGTTVGIVAATLGGNEGSSTPSSSSNGTSGGSIPASNEDQVIRDFQFSNARFTMDAYPINFQPIRFVDDGFGGFYAMGRLRTNNETDAASIPSIVRVNEDFESAWTLDFDLGYQEGITYSQNYSFSTIYHGALLDNKTLLVFGETTGHLLLADNTRVQLGGIFEGENIPTTTRRVFFYGIVTDEGEFTMIDYLTTDNNLGDAYISDMYSLGNDEFIVIGRANYNQGIFEGVTLTQAISSSYIAHFAFENNELTTLNIENFAGSGQFSVNRTFLKDDLLVLSTQATGTIEGYPALNYAETVMYPLFIGFNIDSFEVAWMTAEDSLKINRIGNESRYVNTGNVILGHDDTFLAVIQHRDNDLGTNNSTFVVELSTLGSVVEVRTLGDLNSNSTYFIGRTLSGYFTLGDTSATTGPYESAGGNDLFLTILDKDFEITSFEVWGGENRDGMASWPTVLNSGILIFAADTSSSTGNLAEALEKTDTTRTNFLVILS
jgi:hypothetical protein